MGLTRRTFVVGAGASAAIALPGAAQRTVDLALPGGPGDRLLAPRFSQKGEMIVQRVRPPLLETPFEVFDGAVITPNDRFFVRWSGGDMPTSINAAAFRLAVRGAVKAPQSLSLAEVLRSGPHIEVTAINQCAGNGRGFQEARVSGAQWANGAMGNAVWRGVRLRDLLDRAGIGTDVKAVRFTGLDKPLIEGSPQFIKSIPIEIARRDDTLVAFAMNGMALPLLNGFPLRLVVPGWFATYWVKMLSDIEVLTGEDDSYFMTKTYRMPSVPVKPGDKDFPTVPITTMPPRSWITSHANNAVVKRGERIDLRGLAMGGEVGVSKVELLVNNQVALLPYVVPDDSRYGFRRWTIQLPPTDRDLSIAVRCTNVIGVTQPDEQAWNPSGYARNVVERITLRVA